MLVEDQKLDAVISLPGGVFKPYAGVSTAILLFTKTNSGGTDTSGSTTWTPTACRSTTSAPNSCPPDKLGPVPAVALTRRRAREEQPARHPRPLDAARPAPSARTPRTAQSFCVPKADIAAQGYDLSLNRYKEVVHAEVAHRRRGNPHRLAQLETEIAQGMKELEGMLK